MRQLACPKVADAVFTSERKLDVIRAYGTHLNEHLNQRCCSSEDIRKDGGNWSDRAIRPRTRGKLPRPIHFNPFQNISFLPTMACFSLRLSQKIAIFLQEVNKQRSENGLSPVGTSTAVMFLMARKFNAERAINLYKQYQVSEIL